MQSPARRSLQQTLLSTTQEAAEPPEPAGASPAPASPTREEPAAAKGALGLFCGGWTSLCRPEASIPQRLLALVERVRSPLAAPHDLLGLRWLDSAQLVWVCGVVQSCCSLVVVAMVSIENGTPQPSLRTRDRPSHCGSRPSGAEVCVCCV